MSLDTSAEQAQEDRLLTLLDRWQSPALAKELCYRTEEWQRWDQRSRETFDLQQQISTEQRPGLPSISRLQQGYAELFWEKMVLAGEELREIRKLLEELYPELLDRYGQIPRSGQAIYPARLSRRISWIRGQLLTLKKGPVQSALPEISAAQSFPETGSETARPDGPFEPSSFAWNGKVRTNLPADDFYLLKALWNNGHPKEAISFSEAEQAIGGGEMKPNTIQQRVGRLRRRLEEVGIGIALCTEGKNQIRASWVKPQPSE
jgi:hypothetical protein